MQGQGEVVLMSCRLRGATRQKEMRKAAIKKLGGKCCCCGADQWWNLTIDSREAGVDGKKMYRWVIYGPDECEISRGETTNVDLGRSSLYCYGCMSSAKLNGKCTIEHGEAE